VLCEQHIQSLDIPRNYFPRYLKTALLITKRGRNNFFRVRQKDRRHARENKKTSQFLKRIALLIGQNVLF
jgi:hypothetical protein